MSAAARHVRRLLPRVAALASGEAVPSPCNSICRIDPRTGWCEGCLRSIDEVAAWSSLGDQEKRAVWRELGARAAAVTTQTIPAAMPVSKEDPP